MVKPKSIGRPPSKAPKETVLHLRVDRADLDALAQLAERTGLDRGALARLVLRVGLRIGERDPRDLLAPPPATDAAKG